MKKYLLIFLLAVSGLISCFAQEPSPEKTEAQLLDPPRPHGSGLTYALYTTIPYYNFTVNIWAPTGHSWPGPNYQIIEIVKDGKRVNSKRVGGEPRITDAWGAHPWSFGDSDNSIYGNYVYIECLTRPGVRKQIYLYRIRDDFTISDATVLITREELKKDARDHEELRQFFEKRRSTPPDSHSK